MPVRHVDQRRGDMDSNLESMKDHWDVVDVLSRYASGIDRKDPKLYRACFAESLDVNMGGGLQRGLSADLWVEQALGLVARYQSTQHIISNHSITFEGDRAFCRAEVQAQHWNPSGAWKIGGHYDDDLVRSESGWKIHRLTLKIRWSEITGDGAPPGIRR